MVFWLGLLLYISPPVWRDPQRKHISFPLTIAGLAILQGAFFIRCNDDRRCSCLAVQRYTCLNDLNYYRHQSRVHECGK